MCPGRADESTLAALDFRPGALRPPMVARPGDAMPSQTHEAVLDLLREHPELLQTLLQDALRAPVRDVRIQDGASESLGQVAAVERRADLVVVATIRRRRVVVVVEVQLRPDRRKREVWPLYQASARKRHRAQTLLVVLCVDRRTAAWARQPIALDPLGSVCCPLVIGPDELPTRPDANHTAGQLLLMLLAHGRGPTGAALALAAVTRSRTLDTDRRRVYTDLVLSALTPLVRARLETLMLQDYKLQNPLLRSLEERGIAVGRERGREEGREEGVLAALRAALHDVAAARGLEFTDAWRVKVAEADAPTLRTWLTRAATAPTADAVFDRPI